MLAEKTGDIRHVAGLVLSSHLIQLTFSGSNDDPGTLVSHQLSIETGP
jgi:hypothetical protein